MLKQEQFRPFDKKQTKIHHDIDQKKWVTGT